MQNIFFKFLLVILIAVLVIPSIALASWWNPLSWNWNIFNWFSKPIPVQTQKLAGNDKDAHGCIGSAGYTWCATKNKCLRTWEESCEILSDAYPLYLNLKWSNALPQTIEDVPGFQITATNTENNSGEGSKFFDYYNKKFTASGWTEDDWFLADGVTGHQIGYKKNNDYIILNYNITPGKVTSNENEPLQWTCPCAITYSIFTSQNSAGISQNNTSDWKTITNSQYGFSLKYPSDDFFNSAPGGGYEIPIASAENCNYEVFSDCPDLDKLMPGTSMGWSDNTPHNGKKMTINNTDYCVYGAGSLGMGHAYSEYLYVTIKNNKCFQISFGTESVTDCRIYESTSDQNDCVIQEKNQQTTLKQIISTFKFTK